MSTQKKDQPTKPSTPAIVSAAGDVIKATTPSAPEKDKIDPGDFPVIPLALQGYCTLLIEEIPAKEMITAQNILIASSKDNKTPLGRVIATANVPETILKAGDLVFFNHLAGHVLKIKYKKGHNDVIIIGGMDVKAKFLGTEADFHSGVQAVDLHKKNTFDEESTVTHKAAKN